MRYILKTTLLVASLVVLFVPIWIQRPQLSNKPTLDEWKLTDFELTHPEEVKAAIDHAVNSKRSVIHLHFDWSMYATHTLRFEEFFKNYVSDENQKYVAFHYVDCTSMDPRALQRYLSSTIANYDQVGPAVQGAGEIVWLESGSIVNSSSMYETKSADELVQLTVNTF